MTVSYKPFLSGPDGIFPADSFVCTQRDGAVKLHMTESGPGSEAAISVPTILKETTAKYPDQLAMGKSLPNVGCCWFAANISSV